MGVDHVPVTLRVPFAASSVAVARHELKDWMSTRCTSTVVMDDARMVVSELVGNAVRHAKPLPDGTLIVSWRIDQRGLQVSVTDGGSVTLPHKINAKSSAVAGRGMAIVEAVASSWWAENARSRSTVHALLDIG